MWEANASLSTDFSQVNRRFAETASERLDVAGDVMDIAMSIPVQFLNDCPRTN